MHSRQRELHGERHRGLGGVVCKQLSVIWVRNACGKELAGNRLRRQFQGDCRGPLCPAEMFKLDSLGESWGYWKWEPGRRPWGSCGSCISRRTPSAFLKATEEWIWGGICKPGSSSEGDCNYLARDWGPELARSGRKRGGIHQPWCGNSLQNLKVIRCRTEEEGEVQAVCQVASFCDWSVDYTVYWDRKHSGRDTQVLRGMEMSSAPEMSKLRMAMPVQ